MKKRTTIICVAAAMLTTVTPVGPMTAPQKPRLPPGPGRPLTTPQKPVQPATRGDVLRSAPAPARSGMQEQQPARPGELKTPRRGPGRPGEQQLAPAPAEEPGRSRGQSSRPGFGAGLRRHVGEPNSDHSSGSSQKPSAEAAHDRDANAETNHLLENGEVRVDE